MNFDNCCIYCHSVLDIIRNTKNAKYRMIELNEPDDLVKYKQKYDKTDNIKINFDIIDFKKYIVDNKLDKNYIKIYEKLYLRNIDYYSLYCKLCDKKYALHAGSILYNSDNNILYNGLDTDYIDMYINNPILPRSKDYICINEKCETHNNKKNKEAVLYKIKNTHILYYICTICKQYWRC